MIGIQKQVDRQFPRIVLGLLRQKRSLDPARRKKLIRPVPKFDVVYPYDAASSEFVSFLRAAVRSAKHRSEILSIFADDIERIMATAVNFDTLVLGTAATYGYNRYLMKPHSLLIRLFP